MKEYKPFRGKLEVELEAKSAEEAKKLLEGISVKILDDNKGAVYRVKPSLFEDDNRRVVDVTVKIRKVKALTGKVREKALEMGLGLEDLVLVSGEINKMVKIDGDPVSFLLSRSCCEENGI